MSSFRNLDSAEISVVLSVAYRQSGDAPDQRAQPHEPGIRPKADRAAIDRGGRARQWRTLKTCTLRVPGPAPGAPPELSIAATAEASKLCGEMMTPSWTLKNTRDFSTSTIAASETSRKARWSKARCSR